MKCLRRKHLIELCCAGTAMSKADCEAVIQVEYDVVYNQEFNPIFYFLFFQIGNCTPRPIHVSLTNRDAKLFSDCLPRPSSHPCILAKECSASLLLIKKFFIQLFSLP